MIWSLQVSTLHKLLLSVWLLIVLQGRAQEQPERTQTFESTTTVTIAEVISVASASSTTGSALLVNSPNSTDVASKSNDASTANDTNLTEMADANHSDQNETDAANQTASMASANVSKAHSSIDEVETRVAELSQLLQAEMADLTARLAHEEKKSDRIHDSIDAGWLAYNTSLVFLMQLGFALVEAGSVRKKSYRHVFLKNLLDCSVGMALWLLIGYWIAFPGKWEGSVTDFQKYDLFFVSEEGGFFAFQTVFASTAITIVSGAMAERTRMEAYLLFCGICGALVYAVVVRWTWGGGWLSELDVPYHDFAGSGVVHLTGGAAALVGACLVGPRAGRYEPEASLVDDDQYKPHSLDNIVTGTFILWFGWFGFNPGSTVSLVDDNANVVAIAYVNTMVSPVFAAITVMLVGVAHHSWHRGPEEDRPPIFDLAKICNGVLGGLVGITAGCDVTPVEWTMVVGILSGFAVAFWTLLMVRLKIDDPVDASAVHGCCGCLGILFVGLFHCEDGLLTAGRGDLLFTQTKAALAIAGYVCGTAFVYFYVVHAFGFLRLDMLVEIMGVDRVDFAHIEHVDVTNLEIQAVNRYRAKLLDRFEGHLWGISEEDGLFYAKMHRSVTVSFLMIAMVYNYFFYIYFEWRGWDFFSVVNLAVGCQCAAASHAEFLCKPSDTQIRYCCFTVVIIGIGLAICNFIIAPYGDLLIPWFRTTTLSFSWSLWMHLRVHPVDWGNVCKVQSQADQSQGTSFTHQSTSRKSITFVKSFFEMGSAKGIIGYMASLFLAGRFQHIGESTLSYASVTSDLWVGLDELSNHFDKDKSGSMGTGIALITFALLQCTGTVSRLIVPTRRRSICFFQTVLVITTCSEAPILVLVFLNSDSSLKWVSVFFSSASICFQLLNLMVAVFVRRHADRQAKYRPQLESIPLPRLEPSEAPPPCEMGVVKEDLDVEPTASNGNWKAKKGTPSMVESRELSPLSPKPPDTSSDEHGTPLMTSRMDLTPQPTWRTPRSSPSPRMTTPRPLPAVQSLIVMPSVASRRHSPMNTPRGYTPRIP